MVSTKSGASVLGKAPGVNEGGISACIVCDQPITPRGAGRSQKKYCSAQCRDGRTRGRDPLWRVGECLYCGRWYITRHKTQWHCSRECVRATPVRERVLEARATGRLGEHMTHTCWVCGRHTNRTTVCPECIHEPWRIEHDTYRERTCGICGRSFGFIPSGGRGLKYCSEECTAEAYRRAARRSSRITKGIRRARQRAVRYEPVDPLKVFARDGWRCQICGVRTPASLRGGYDDCAPELDHIVPLSQGGEHTYANTQCACRRCNGVKGNGSMSDQLRLELTA